MQRALRLWYAGAFFYWLVLFEEDYGDMFLESYRLNVCACTPCGIGLEALLHIP